MFPLINSVTKLGYYGKVQKLTKCLPTFWAVLKMLLLM